MNSGYVSPKLYVVLVEWVVHTLYGELGCWVCCRPLKLQVEQSPCKFVVVGQVYLTSFR